MNRKIVNNIREQKGIALKSIIGLSLLLFCACTKSDEENMQGALTVSISEHQADAISRLNLAIEGGKDTIYVFSSSDVNLSFQTAELEEWVTIAKKEYMSQINATRVILDVQPLTEGFAMRSGVLNITTQEKYSGNFLKLYQGFETRFAEDFTWLKYGNANPLDLTASVLMDNWSTAQKQYGWTSTTLEDQNQAFLYGKNGYLQLGSELVGADLYSPIIPSLGQDSVLLLTFDAVSYISREGVRDNNELTINLSGGEFEDGSNSRVIELGYFDYLSALLDTKMWENSKFSFLIKKPKNNPNASTVQLHFVTNTDTEVAENRVFLDNIALFSVTKFEEDKN